MHIAQEERRGRNGMEGREIEGEEEREREKGREREREYCMDQMLPVKAKDVRAAGL